MLSRVPILNSNGICGLFDRNGREPEPVVNWTPTYDSRRELSDFGAASRLHYEFPITLESYHPPEERRCASKTYLFEVDDPPEARTWEIEF